jgi:hypothetical protein
MQGMMKRFWDRLMNGTSPLCTDAPKTTEPELSTYSAEFMSRGSMVAGGLDIAPSDREIRVPEAIEEEGDRQPTLAKVNAIRLNLAQRIVFERDARRTRTANVMRSASDMLGLLSKELTAQDRR